MHDPRDDPGPPGLVTGAEPGTVVPVEVLVEQQQVTPVRVLLERGGAAVYRPPPILVLEKDRFQAPSDLLRHLVQVHPLTRSGRTLDPEAVAVIRVVLQQRPHDETI